MPNDRLATLRERMAVSVPRLQISLAAPHLDACAPGGIDTPVLDAALTPASLHEIHAGREADVAALAGFTLGVARWRAAGRPIVLVRQEFLDAEAGCVHAPGLAEIGIDPAAVTLVRTREASSVLQAGLDATRCPAVGAVVIELWGETPALDLTAGRRLSLAARASGVTVLMARVAARPAPSGAETRWRVSAAPSRAEPANAPGVPAFAVELLRRRGGEDGRAWCVEWNRDRACFEERGDVGDAALSRPVVSLPADRPTATSTPAAFARRAG